MLDLPGGGAVCLAREGERFPIPVHETDTNGVVAWNAYVRIDGAAFHVTDRSGGSARTILGYPAAPFCLDRWSLARGREKLWDEATPKSSRRKPTPD
jgi:hypothetical protein